MRDRDLGRLKGFVTPDVGRRKAPGPSKIRVEGSMSVPTAEPHIPIAAMSQSEMRVMLEDGTILAIRSIHGQDGREVESWEDATSFLITDHRTTPPTLMSVQIDAVEFSPEA